MIDLVIPVYEQYRTTTGLFVATLSGMSEEVSQRKINDNTNPAVFIAGHIVYGRFVSANLLGLDVGYPFDGKCNRGAALEDSSVYPSLEESILLWDEISKKVFHKLEEISEDKFMAKPFRSFPTADETIRGALIFMGCHDKYHIGQLMMLRKSFGLKSVIG